MQYKLIAVVDGTQGSDYESYLTLKNDLTSLPTSLADFIGGQGRFADGYAPKDYDVVIRSANGLSGTVEIGLETATWIVSAGGALTAGQALSVSGDAKFDRLIVISIKNK